MKLKSLMLLFIFFGLVCNAQIKKPEFEFTLYGEDARGHKDSVIIGFDHNARADGMLDTAFGDKNIVNVKFDSVFEMRVHKTPYLTPQKYAQSVVSKRITLKYVNYPTQSTCFPMGSSPAVFVLMKVKYPPFKLSWNKKLFEKVNSSCVGASYLIFNEYLLQELTPAQNMVTVYLSKDSILKDSFMRERLGDIKIIYQNSNMDTLQANYVFQFLSTDLPSSVQTISRAIEKSYPNPTVDQLYLFLPELGNVDFKVIIYSMNGVQTQTAFKFVNDILSVNTSSLLTGNYIVEILTDENKRYIAKFEKTE